MVEKRREPKELGNITGIDAVRLGGSWKDLFEAVQLQVVYVIERVT